VVELGRPQLLHRLLVEPQQQLHQLLQRIHQHDTYPTSKPLIMPHLA
jgi:hypothetical protein